MEKFSVQQNNAWKYFDLFLKKIMSMQSKSFVSLISEVEFESYFIAFIHIETDVILVDKRYFLLSQHSLSFIMPAKEKTSRPKCERIAVDVVVWSRSKRDSFWCFQTEQTQLIVCV